MNLEAALKKAEKKQRIVRGPRQKSHLANSDRPYENDLDITEPPSSIGDNMNKTQSISSATILRSVATNFAQAFLSEACTVIVPIAARICKKLIRL